MTQFIFKARSNLGHKSSGIINTINKETAIKILSERNLLVTKLIEVKLNHSKNILNIFKGGKLHIKTENLLTFTQELGAMLNAGISLKQAIDMMIADMEVSPLRQILLDLGNGLNSGNTFSDTLSNYPEIFSKLYISMIQAGEKSGKLPETMLDMAKYIENSENIKKRIVGALYYPGIVLTFALFVTFIILTFGVPRLEGVYSGLKGSLPLPTKIFITIGIFLSKIWFIFPVLIMLLIIVLKKILKKEHVQIYIDDFKLRNAMFGNLFRRLAIAKFARTLSLLYGSGVSIIQAMEIVIKTTDNKVVQKTLLGLIKNLHEGEPIANYIRKSNLFTNIAINMIAAGEESGTLELMLTKLANFYEYQINTTLQSLTTLLEPIIMLFVGAVIAAVILILSLPFLELGAIFK